MIDLNAGVFYMFYEFGFPTMAKTVQNDNLHVIYQTSSQPGLSSASGSTVAVHDNNWEHRAIPGSVFWPTGIDNNGTTSKSYVGQNFPNPAQSTTSFNLNLDKSASVTVAVCNIMGQKLMVANKGMMQNGAHKITLDCTQYNSGVYFYTVKINGESFTHKMIVE